MPTPYSHLTQQLLNYYDPTDARVRNYRTTIDSQLFNIAANAMEDLDLRYTREVQSRFVQTCPLHIDNQGVYTAAPLPNDFVLPDEGSNPPLNSVQGLRNGAWVALQPYDDRLPKPTRVAIDTTRKVTAMDSPKLFDWTSDGSLPQFAASGAFTLPIPSQLTFWMEGAEVAGNVDILVTGIAYPCSAWQKNRQVVSEQVLYAANEGIARTTTVWYSVQSVVIRNAPAGVRVACWHFPFALPAVTDADRPHTRAEFRDRTFDRYWSLDQPWLTESFHGGPSVELATINRYAVPEPLTDINVEPHSYALLGVSPSKLYVLDRRMRLPDKLDVTGLTYDPMYSVNVVPDETKTNTAVRYVQLQALAHAGAAAVFSSRYIVQDPNGMTFCVDPSGAFLTYTSGSGWSSGVPATVSIPLAFSGTYVVTLQCMDTSGTVTEDNCPYFNPAVAVLAEIDLSGILPSVLGIARDSLERLWVWTGAYAVPLQLFYDAYVLDYDSRTVYLTDAFDKVTVS